MMNPKKSIAVIGGGPAGMAAAVSAKKSGVDQVILMERQDYLGGVLPQCIHPGFGTQLYEADYTGGEYAWIWVNEVQTSGVEVHLSTTVLSVTRSEDDFKWMISCVSAREGAKTVAVDAVIAATGCRERTLPQMLIPGSRPAGVYTAGAAQLMMNIKNYLPGRSVVILGSGDIGLIMARRMALEGILVKLILGQKSTGLARNIVQCVQDFDIPMRYGWTLVSTHGYQRLKGVTVAPVREDGKTDFEHKEYIPCDTLLVATGLIPELEVLRGIPEEKRSEDQGIFITGNSDFVHDLADHVTEEGIYTGALAASWLGFDVTLPKAGSPAGIEKTGKQGNFICTVCPKGCIMQVESKPFHVFGNQCERGEEFAKQELENPKRVLTAVVKTDDPLHPVLSVRTSIPIDKQKIPEVMNAIKRVSVSGHFVPGQVVKENIANTNADLIATWVK